MENIIQIIVNFIGGFAGQYPAIATLFMIMGALRIIFKPLFALLRAITDATPSMSDNNVLDTVEKSPAFKAISFVLDYVASIKISKK